MYHSKPINLNNCNSTNDLLPYLVDKLGLAKTKMAIHQVYTFTQDIKKKPVIPLLIIETCGIGFIHQKALVNITELNLYKDDIVILYSYKLNLIQLIDFPIK